MDYINKLNSNPSLKLRLFYLIVAGLLVSSCENGKLKNQNQAEAEYKVGVIHPKSKIEEEILVQEKTWASALVANDLNTVESLMHSDFRLNRAYGDAPSISKEMYLGMKGMSASSADVTSIRIAEEMDSIVVARVTWTMDWYQEGVGKLPSYFDMIDIWKKSKTGNWQILSRVSQIVDEPYNGE